MTIVMTPATREVAAATIAIVIGMLASVAGRPLMRLPALSGVVPMMSGLRAMM